MNGAAIPGESWPLRRWSIAIALALALQVAAIFWFNEKPSPHISPAVPQTTLRYLENFSPELLALSDPTLFALPNRQNFSGLAWLRIPRPELPVIEWTEPTNWLTLSPGHLGETWGSPQPIRTASILQNAIGSEPAMNIPDPAPLPFPSESSFYLEEKSGPKISLAQPLKLRSWSSSEILSNSVVSAMVDGEGIPRSVALLSKCGLPDADRYALDQVSHARFHRETPSSPARPPLADLRWLTVVFRWHTDLVAATNPPAGAVRP